MTVKRYSAHHCGNDRDDAEHEVDTDQFAYAIDAFSGCGAFGGAAETRIGAEHDQHEHRAHDQAEQHHGVDVPGRISGAAVEHEQHGEAAQQYQWHGVPDHQEETSEHLRVECDPLHRLEYAQ